MGPLRRLEEANHHKLQILALDVTDLSSIKAAEVEVDGQAIDLLINNAGVGGPRVLEFDEDGTPRDAIHERRAGRFLDEFEWYSVALKEARARCY